MAGPGVLEADGYSDQWMWGAFGLGEVGGLGGRWVAEIEEAAVVAA